MKSIKTAPTWPQRHNLTPQIHPESLKTSKFLFQSRPGPPKIHSKLGLDTPKSKRKQQCNNERKSTSQGPPFFAKNVANMATTGHPRSIRNRSKHDPKIDIFWNGFWHRFWMPYGSVSGSNLASKIDQNWTKIGFKMHFIWDIVFGYVLGAILEPTWSQPDPKIVDFSLCFVYIFENRPL